jgi:hypothetical protein
MKRQLKRVLGSLPAVCLAVFLTAQLAGAAALNLAANHNRSAGGRAGLVMLESDANGLVLELEVPAFQAVETQSDTGPCSRVDLPGWDIVGEPGTPAVPARVLLLALPPGASPTLTVLAKGEERVERDVDLCPAATALPSPESADPAQPLEALRMDPSAYAIRQYLPAEMARWGESGMIRSQRVAQLLVQPYQYNPVERSLRYPAWVRVRVEYGAPPLLNGVGPVEEGEYEAVLAGSLLNYADGKAWRVRPRTAPALSAAAVVQPAYKLTVTQDGMVRVTYAELAAAGVPVDSLDPRTLRLERGGLVVDILVEGESDGVFDPGDAVVFYGQKENTHYAGTAVYWLYWGGANGARMAPVDGAPAGGSTPAAFRTVVRREDNKSYQSARSSGVEKDHWFWELINVSAPTTKTYTLTLPGVAAAGSTARLRGSFTSFAANPSHHTHLSINNHLVLEQDWDALSELNFDVEFPQSYLVEGTNTIKVEVPLTGGITQEGILVDWFEVEYWKNYQGGSGQTAFSAEGAAGMLVQVDGFPLFGAAIWDISDPLHPLAVTNALWVYASPTYRVSLRQESALKRDYLAVADGGYLAVAGITPAQAEDLKTPAEGADYLIISHAAFVAAIQPLADFHAAEGLRVKVVDAADIYDEFNYGVFSPEAIRAFIAYAYANWPAPAPRYVLLVGDGNYDYRNYRGTSPAIYIPPLLADVDPWLGEIAADNRFVTVSGDDLLPDLAIGRFPVKSAAETTALVNKTLGYPGPAGDWQRRVSLAAAANDPTAGNFPVLSDEIAANYLREPQAAANKIYYLLTPNDNLTKTRESILAAFNQGSLLIHYSGHSTISGWYGDGALPGSSVMFSAATSLPGLTNTSNLPVVLSMTCLTGMFANPVTTVSVLDKSLLLLPTTGSVASWSPTGKGLASGHHLLDQGFFTAVYTQGVTDLGGATNAAKIYLFSHSTGYRDLLDTYVVLGDPALRLPVEWRVNLPVVIR